MSKHYTKKFNNKSNTISKEDVRGNWEAAFFQRGKIKIDEQCIKTNCPTGSFNPYNIPDLMNPRLSKEEEISKKKNNGEKLTKTETMIYENYTDKHNKQVESDLKKLELHGLNAKPETDEGRIRLLFKTIEYYFLSRNSNPKADDMIYYAFNKIIELNISDKLLIEYDEIITKIKNVIADLDIIDLQFNRFHSNMPPLNEKGFVRLDPFQKEVITNIDNKISTIVQAPTSAGKSILTGYLYTNNKTSDTIKAIVVVPTDPLAWQMSSMIGKITKKDIPLITRTFQSDTTRDGLIKKIKSVGIVVGTPQYLADFLPLLDIKFDWLVVDEIHMIGKESCQEMELIIKAYSDIPILALSATIGNADMLKDWFIKTGHKDDISIVKCEKRFFNLQKFYYDKGQADDALVRIHPFSMVNFNDIKTGKILSLTLNATPPDIWDLAIKLNSVLTPELKIKKYFNSHNSDNSRISLDEATEYFMKLLHWMVENCDKPKYKKKIEEIISKYQLEEISNKTFDLYEIAMHLKKNNKTPALVFQTDSHLCLEYVRKFSKTIREEEEKAHPTLLEQRLKEQQRIRNESKRSEQILMVEDRKSESKNAKKAVKINLDKAGDKKYSKLMMMNDNFDDINEKPADVAIYEPHPDFILNNNQQFSQYMIKEWDKELKSFFPHHGSEYHYMIDLLWRGVGVYCKGLPDPYLHIVQNLACDGKLGVVFSDDSLVFGVSMPFRTTVITPDENINSMMYHQMAGRAGRRGLDKEGNVILVGYKPEKIIELTCSTIPNINGCDTMFYGANYGSLLHEAADSSRWDNIKKNFLLDKITDEIATDFYDGINENLNDGWNFAVNSNTGFKHMMWRFRQSDDGFRVAFLLSFIRKIYKNCDAKIERNQIEISKFLSNYIEIHENKNDCRVESTEHSIKYNVKEHLETLGLETIENIDGRVYESIRINKLYETENRKEKSILRERLLIFGEKVRNIQHYFFHCNEETITVLLGKLLTRIWWIYHLSSPVMEPIERYDIQEEIINMQLSSSDSSDDDDE